MAGQPVPKLANEEGVEKIFVGVRELQCIGARPPMDHPHVYLDMGDDSQKWFAACQPATIVLTEWGRAER